MKKRWLGWVGVFLMLTSVPMLTISVARMLDHRVMVVVSNVIAIAGVYLYLRGTYNLILIIGPVLLTKTGSLQAEIQEEIEKDEIDQTRTEPEKAPSIHAQEPSGQQATLSESNQPTQEADIPKPLWELIPDVGNDRLIVRLWSEGHSVKSIAQELGRNPHTIQNRLSLLRGINSDAIVLKDGSRKKKV